jgi:hypothetical protein
MRVDDFDKNRRELEATISKLDTALNCALLKKNIFHIFSSVSVVYATKIRQIGLR